ncbi:unnamed protein product [Ilex paraguariensis]|uniref:Plant invertase/pectin methylesterase inhibitor superfamily protein n=1 Tax=Ilex paraguariensis TaxID=185542 RepID=A0ABC8SPW4_9AQUA
MNTLDSPLEALAFNYLSFGLFTVVNNIWTWVAVITAALSFWRIRSSGLLKSDLLDRNLDGASPAAVFSSPSSSPAENIAEPASSTSASASDFPAMSKITSFCRVEGDGLTKGKYTVYYNEDDDEFTSNEEEVDNRDGEGVEVVAKEWCDGWDRVLRMRNGDMGWYRYQDLTVLDGNVVRLWDGCTRSL